MRGRGIFHFQTNTVSVFIVFAVLLYRAVLSLSYTQQAHQKNKGITLTGVCTYVRHVSERSGRNRPGREA